MHKNTLNLGAGMSEADPSQAFWIEQDISDAISEAEKEIDEGNMLDAREALAELRKRHFG